MLQVRLQRIPGLTAKDVLRSHMVFGAILNDFTWDETATWRDFATVSAGMRTQPSAGKGSKGRDLRSLTMDVLTQWGGPLPFENARGGTGGRIRSQLQAILRSRTPVRFVATLNNRFDADNAELRMDARILSISRSLRHGEPDTRYLTVEIAEFRGVDTERRSRTQSDKFPTSRHLREPDTLRSLAKLYYSNRGSLWRQVRKGNGGAKGRLKHLGPDESIVRHTNYKVGDKLKIIAPPPKKGAG